MVYLKIPKGNKCPWGYNIYTNVHAQILGLVYLTFLVSDNICRLLINFANNLDPDRNQQTVWHYDSVPERNFWK